MLDHLPFLPDRASSFAANVDYLFLFLIGLSLFFGLLIATLIIYFAIKYRRKSEEIPEQISGSIRLEIVWTVIPLLIAMGIFVWGADVYVQIYRPPAAPAMNVYVVGKQWMWKFQHTTGQREINQLHIPVNSPIHLTAASEDVIHSFFVPDFRVKADVIPGSYRTFWFEAIKPGTYHLFCAEYCGAKHAGMGGEIIVMSARDYENWLAGGGAMGSLAEQGHKLFLDLACHTCHEPQGTGRGPVLQGLYGKQVTLNNGQTVTVDEAYIRESILDPAAKVAAGFQPIMPTFRGQVSEEDLLRLTEYIKSLSTSGQHEVIPPQPARGPEAGENTNSKERSR
ncbi:MAG: cytochrome c oxidase subunit II [Acidobacteria bacterium]|nr:MAG: cytochrome c oxidase subunit II [Acidobacteriota bacterium]